jgi:oligosaccharide repeat unit polymerase
MIIRGCCTLTALFLIVMGIFYQKEKPDFTIPVLFLLFFWFIYAVRIIYDINQGIKLSIYDSTYIYGFTFGNCLIPLIAIIFWAKYIDIFALPKALFIIFILSNIAILSTIIYYNNGFDVSIFLSRAQINSEELSRNQDNVILTPITIGYHGAFLIIVSLYYLSIEKKRNTILCSLTLFLGLLNIILGASRGPFINCVLVLLVLFIYNYRISKSALSSMLKAFFFIVPLFIGFFVVLSKYIDLEDVQMFSRLFSFYESRQNNEAEERDFLYNDAWGLFLQSPLIGKQFVTSNAVGNTYPHNIFLELLMALGLSGGIIFGVFFFYVCKYLFQIFWNLRTKDILLLLIYLQIILGVLFSGTLLMSIDFWLFTALILMIGTDENLLKNGK